VGHTVAVATSAVGGAYCAFATSSVVGGAYCAFATSVVGGAYCSVVTWGIKEGKKDGKSRSKGEVRQRRRR
jgi:hypothetical protein